MFALVENIKILPSVYKDAVHITHQSMIVYQYVCRCDCRSADRTSLRLQDRINLHISKSIHNKENPTKVLPKRNCKITTPLIQPDCDSAIGLHLFKIPIVPLIIILTSFLFLPKLEHFSTWERWRQLSSKPRNLFCAVKRNLSTRCKFSDSWILKFIHIRPITSVL